MVQNQRFHIPMCQQLKAGLNRGRDPRPLREDVGPAERVGEFGLIASPSASMVGSENVENVIEHAMSTQPRTVWKDSTWSASSLWPPRLLLGLSCTRLPRVARSFAAGVAQCAASTLVTLFRPPSVERRIGQPHRFVLDMDRSQRTSCVRSRS